MNATSCKRHSPARAAALLAAGFAAAALWAGVSAAGVTGHNYVREDARGDRFPRRAGGARAQAQAALEIRVKDHRNAIDDFRSVDLSFGKLRLAPHPGLRSADPGWLELAPRLERLDLTRYKDGTAAATLYRGRLRPQRFAAVHLQVTGLRALLRKTGAPHQVRNAVRPIRLDFELKPAAATVVVLDLELLDLSDHPGRGYELLIKGYELYEDDRLLRKIPPG